MRKLSTIFLLLLCVMPFSYGRTGTQAKLGARYPIKVRISGIHIRTHCSSGGNFCNDVLYANATLNGEKVDLMGVIVPMPLGDYVARQEQSPVPGLQEIGQKYEMLLRDQTVWHCTVAGFSE